MQQLDFFAMQPKTILRVGKLFVAAVIYFLSGLGILRRACQSNLAHNYDMDKENSLDNLD